MKGWAEFLFISFGLVWFGATAITAAAIGPSEAIGPVLLSYVALAWAREMRS